MTIQIGKLRTWVPNGETEAKVFFKAIPKFIYPDLKTLFDNIKEDLPKFVDEKENYNLFYTVAHHLKGQRTKSSWQAQDIIPFDLDGIDLNKIDYYPKVIAEACGFDLDKCAIVHSGNGCHVLVQVPQWSDTDFIKDARLGYKQLYDRIMTACEEAKLPIEKDTTAWDYARILRLPYSRNEKVKNGVKVIKEATIQYNNLAEQPYNIPVVAKEQKALSLKKGTFPRPDAKTVLKECDFFKWLEAAPDEVHEPHAYAMLSIAGHFDDEGATAAKLWNAFSSPSINSKDLHEFTEQALSTAGPRTCEGIDAIYGKCKECPNYNKVTSPIMLKDPNFIGTEFMGFTTRSISGKSLIRYYDDLKNFFKREHHYKHIPETSDIYVFDKTHYTPYHPARLKKYAQDHFTKPVKESERVEYLKCVEAGDYTPISWLEKKPRGKINFNNGILNIDTGTMGEHDPEFNFTTVLPFNYDPDAKCPTWDKFIEDVTLGREDLKNILHEYMGYCAYGGEYEYHKALVLSGGGKNGKSTFIDVLRAIIGDENTSTVPLTSLAKDVFAMADMHGKLVNVSEEEPASCFKETGVFKNLTGNNVVRAQKKFKTPFTMLSRAKIIISYNEMPFISDTSTGMRRRLLIVPFDLDLENNTDKVNVRIKDDLAKELPGIFNNVLAGWKRLSAQGDFSKSSSVNNAVKEIMEGSNSFSFWAGECLESGYGEREIIKTSDAFNSYIEFMTENNERNSMGRRKFSQELKNNGYSLEVIKLHGKAIRGFRHYKLLGGASLNQGF